MIDFGNIKRLNEDEFHRFAKLIYAESGIRLPAAKGIIASKLNLSAEHFSRLLRELAERGLLTVSQRTLAIPSIERLRNALV